MKVLEVISITILPSSKLSQSIFLHKQTKCLVAVFYLWKEFYRNLKNFEFDPLQKLALFSPYAGSYGAQSPMYNWS